MVIPADQRAQLNGREPVAWHPPYVLRVFDTRFIEIRHVETGRLAYIIPGNDVGCIWDGRGTTNCPTSSVPGPEVGWTEGVSQEPRIHGVKDADHSLQPMATSRGARSIAQHVFELILTIPLCPPKFPSSPLHAMQIAESDSPPRSPRLKPALSS